MEIPLKNPRPDAESFKQIILGRKAPRKVPLAEVHIDTEIIRYVTENVLDGKWVAPSSQDEESRKVCMKNYIECWYRLGYDYIRLSTDFRFSAGVSFESKSRKTADTAELKRTERKWTEEGAGAITTWEDFENYQWPSLNEVDLWPYEFAADNLPEGMGILACGSQGVFENVMNNLMGYENLSYALYDNPDLVQAVFDKTGELVYGWYEKILGLKNLIGFYQGEDMGFKTGPLVPPDVLRKYVFPWHKKIAALAHKNGLIYILHNCGECTEIMDDLIDDVKIDAKHSFEDEIMPVAEFKRKYGNRIALLGGVDVDKLCRLSEEDLRKYVRDILDACMPGGRYAVGSGNSVANYVPAENYLAMLDEAQKWSR